MTTLRQHKKPNSTKSVPEGETLEIGITPAGLQWQCTRENGESEADFMFRAATMRKIFGSLRAYAKKYPERAHTYGALPFDGRPKKDVKKTINKATDKSTHFCLKCASSLKNKFSDVRNNAFAPVQCSRCLKTPKEIFTRRVIAEKS